MSDIGILEAKTRLSNVVDRALAGEEMVLTRHGRPLVKLVPVAAQAHQQAQRVELLKRIRRRRDQQPLQTEPSAHELVNDGRKL